MHAFSIALGAVLLFLLQPMLGRQLLPWLGGAASVWSACLVVFQGILLGGYIYADRLAHRLSPRAQRSLHLSLLVGSLLFVPAVPKLFFDRPVAETSPTLAIVIWILGSAGLPLLLLSASSPLLSAWYRDGEGGRSVYRLYALSNAGSLLAVFAYPFLVEPYFTLRQQKLGWSALYGMYVATVAVAAFRLRGPANAMAGERFEEELNQVGGSAVARATPLGPPLLRGGETAPADRNRRALWFVLAMCGSAMLTATTNQICQEIAVVPFLWLAPLGIYLLTLIVAFDHPRWYRRGWWMAALALMTLPQCGVLFAGARIPFEAQLGVSLLTLLAACAVCHGELSSARPTERQLTKYYLVIAAGGCAGGLLVAILAPHIFPGYWEYHLSLWGSCLAGVVAAHANRGWNSSANPEIRLLAGMGLVALAVVLVGEAWAGGFHAHVTRRSFYGIVRLVEGEDNIGEFRKLAHGRTAHGMQYVDEDRQDWATLYFGRRSAVGITFHHLHAAGRPLRVGVVGLGTGTVAAYGKSGDHFRFYELDSDVDWFARKHFTFLSRSKAGIETVLGDARVSMERELQAGSQEYDLLIVDAFRSDAIPIHLLTRECGEIYFRHLKDDGTLLIHISNRSVDLAPVVRGLARAHNRPVVRVHAGLEPERGAVTATWLAVTRNASLGERLQQADETPSETRPVEIVWTDDFSAVWPILRRFGDP